MDNAFTHLLRVRYSECDAQKVVFNAKYVEYIDIAFTEFMRQVWGDYNDMLSSGIDSQVVNVNIDWTAPAYFDDILAIRLKTTHIGNTSYTVQADFTNHKSGTKIASAKIVYVMVSANEHKKIPIPEEMKSQLSRGAPGTTTNHAGIQL